MSLPVTKVEFGFTQSAGAYVYQDITAYVRNVSIQRGIQRENDTFQAGSCTIVLDNNLRAFDPYYTSSPFYGEVKPQASVRVTAAGQVIFVGFVDSWAYDYQIVADATATLVAYDAIARLSKAQLPAISWTSENTSNRVINVLNRAEVNWPAGQRDIAAGVITLGNDSIMDGTIAWDYLQTVAQSEGGAVFISRDGNVTFKSQAASEVPGTVTSYRYNLSLNPSVEVNANNWQGSRSSTLAYKGTWSMQGATFTEWDVLPPIAPSSLYGVLYSDAVTSWVQNTSYTFSVWVYSDAISGQAVTLTAGFKKTGGSANLDVQTQTQTLPAGAWTRFSVTVPCTKSGQTAYVSIDGLYTNIWVDALLIEASPYLDVWFDGGNAPTNTATQTFTSAWNGTANNSASTLTTVTTYNANQKNAIIVGDNGGTAIPYEQIRVVYGSETLYTNTVVNPVSGTAQTAASTMGSAYGTLTYTIDPSLTADNANALSLANYYLSIYDNPQLRFESVSFGVHALTAQQQVQVLQAGIWQAASVTYTPSAIGSAIVQYQRIVSVAHEITPETFSTTLGLAQFGSYFRLDSANFGVLDSNALGY